MKADSFFNSHWIKLAKKKGSEQKVRQQFSRWLRRVANLQLAGRAKRLWKHLNSDKVTAAEKVVIVGALLYLITPLDLVPDFVPIAGWLDDLGVATLALNYIMKKVEGK